MLFPYIKHALKNIFKPPVTYKYPEVPVKVANGYRGRIRFDSSLCIGCGMCIKVCSPGAITKSVKIENGQQEITMTFDLGSCTYCQMCADFCVRKAISLTNEYSMVEEDKKAFIVQENFVKKLPPKPPIKNIDTRNDKSK